MGFGKFISKIFKRNKQDLMECLPDGMVLIDDDGDFLMSNDVAEEMLSDIKENFQNYNINDIFNSDIIYYINIRSFR